MQAAERTGYRHNPLASALMGEMRRSRAGVFRGVIALLDPTGPERRTPARARYFQAVADGAAERARELCFQADVIVAGRAGFEAGRLADVFEARGVRGVFLLPGFGEPAPAGVDWSRVAALQAEPAAEGPGLDSVGSDFFQAIRLALGKLRERGCRRPGLVLDGGFGDEVDARWAAAYHASAGEARAEPLRLEGAAKADEARFAGWAEAGRFDAVLACDLVVGEWIRNAAGPAARGTFFCPLGGVPAPGCVGAVDLRPRVIGRHGIELLTERIMRNEAGPSESPIGTWLRAEWVAAPAKEHAFVCEAGARIAV